MTDLIHNLVAPDHARPRDNELGWIKEYWLRRRSGYDLNRTWAFTSGHRLELDALPRCKVAAVDHFADMREVAHAIIAVDETKASVRREVIDATLNGAPRPKVLSAKNTLVKLTLGEG